MLSTIVLILLILLVIAALGGGSYWGWGYWPGGLLGTALVIFVILLLLGFV
jgi:hypothetical protein